MRSNPSQARARAGGRMVTQQQAVFELKHRVVLSLNKLADRDTQQIGADELEKAAESLTPDMIAPFLSCITDTDSEQKSAVRKECVRVMGTLARAHGSLLAPYLPKMVASIVKRLKDSDSVVRDACVETCGVLATSIRSTGRGDGGGTAFVALARPLFEALGEQNRYVQAGSALCLTRVIDEASDPPMSILPQMLARVVKMLKNPHFMAKPAVIELIRSIIQAGGASTEHALSTALNGILDALKSSDWTTRKAASVALAGIAVSAGALLGSFKSFCIRSLEVCRFDKVKPVRDAIMQAIQCWKTLPGAGSPEPSEAGSSTKENFGGDYHDITSASDSGWRDTSFRKVGPVSLLSGNSTSSTKKRAPLSVRKACTNYVPNHQHIKSNDWHIEISLPKSHAMPLPGVEQKESDGRCIPKSFDRIAADATGEQDIKYSDTMDDKPECSSVSDLISGSYETKHLTVPCECLEDGDSANVIGMNHKPAIDEAEPELLRTQQRKSLDSTVTDYCSQTMHGCCLHAANELALIRKQLLEIETKQSNLLDLLQVFMGNAIDNLSTLKFKVHNLELAVDKISQGITQNENYSSSASSRLLKKNQNISLSPRLSTCTPRPSTDSNYKQPSLLSMKNKELWGENATLKSRSSTSVKEGVELWKDPTLNIIRNPIAKSIQNSGRNAHRSGNGQARDAKDLHSVSASNDSTRQSNLEGMTGFWKRVNEFLSTGDVESAYVEALCSTNDLCLIELMDRTGPVLERLSCETASEVLNILTTHFLDQRILDSTISWLQQVVDLSTAHEPRHLFMSPEAQMEFLLSLQELVAVGFSDPVDRISISQLVVKLSQVWGEAPCRKVHPTRGLRGNRSVVANARA